MKAVFKHFTAILCTLVFSICLLASCSKSHSDHPEPPDENKVDVYVAGTQMAGSKEVATLWKNGVATNLTTAASSATGVSVLGNDVYVTGAELLPTSKYIARLWKNGVAQSLSLEGADHSSAQTIFVSGADVFVGGYETLSGKRRAKIWKNGKLRYTFPKNTIELVYNIYVQDNEVYVVGYPTLNGCYWKLSDRNESLVQVPALNWSNDIFVSGADVYLSGNKEQIARYTKNGTAVDLTTGTGSAYCSVIFVSGSDIYTAGGEEGPDGNYVAKYWKNGNLTNLTDGSNDTNINAIFVWNEKVYIAGTDGDFPLLWQDDKLVKFPKEGAANGVFVVDRPK